ncbi:MAG TPA: LytTR family DNA-binding domain-containing protein [Propionibacteriaceae bacterium]|nr:LytTR family DNA-binding domain-containing protein [Propionibacteriaceae bacterium]
MNLLIVDDEPAARMGLVRLCQEMQDVHVVGQAGTGAGAIEAAASLRPDLMLLDADLPDMSGFDVLCALRRRQQRRTILLTANTQEASRAFAAGASDFLVKPVTGSAFSASILRARARRVPRPMGAPHRDGASSGRAASAPDPGAPQFLVGEREHRLYPLETFEIDYVESAGNYVTYHRAGVEYIARESIKRLEIILAPAGFVRIERSLLLNVRAIAYAQPIGRGSFAFTLTTGASLHSGHTYRDMILAALPLRRRTPGH